MNVSLLCKWSWKLETKNGVWKQIINFKYLKNDSICIVKHKQTDSAIWFDLLKVRDIYLQGRNVEVGNGQKPYFGKISGYTMIPWKFFSLIYLLCAFKKISLLTR